MAEEFEAAVEDGLRLAKRIYFGKDRAVAPPKPPTAMERTAGFSYLPTSPMLYAVIYDPAIVDNPDMPSYQPHVHGRLDPPALLPLQMNGISLEVDCYLDTAFVTVEGMWRVHCVMGSRSCDCRIAVPMGEEGSILGVEVEVPRKSYSTQLVAADMYGEETSEKIAKLENGGFLQSHIFTLTIPQIDGGTNISVKLRWSQKLLFHDGEFTLKIPFNFPEYVTPAAKKISKREKIRLNISAGSGTELLFRTASHPLKERLRQAGKVGFLYESDVLSWSSSDFVFTYTVPSSHSFGGVLLNSPSGDDVDQRDMFSCYIYPGKQSGEVFRREVVFTVDVSGSMKGKPLEDTKTALFTALAKLHPADYFNIIAFHGETFIFSSCLEPATAEFIENAIQWINLNFVADGGTNILLPLSQAIKMFSGSAKTIPMIFLITDGTVNDERQICDVMKHHLTNKTNISPRIYTLGIGTFCNHYFLRMLAIIGRGHYASAVDVDKIEARIGRLFAKASSICLINTTFENVDKLHIEVFPSQILDLSSESPLIISGRYRGKFPETLKVKGILADMSESFIDLKVEEGKDMPIVQIVAKHQIGVLTAEAWYSENKELEQKIAKISAQSAVVSEYTSMVLLEKAISNTISTNTKKVSSSKADPHNSDDPKSQKTSLILHQLGVGFGNLNATTENIPPGSRDITPPDAAEVFVKAASNCCGRLCTHCCCMCCIQTCSKMNDQCAIVLAQLLSACAIIGCYSCCAACCGGED